MIFIVSLLLSILPLAAAPPQAPGHDATVRHHFEPSDLPRWMENLEDPERDTWQKPEEVLRFLEVAEGHKLSRAFVVDEFAQRGWTLVAENKTFPYHYALVFSPPRSAE